MIAVSHFDSCLASFAIQGINKKVRINVLVLCQMYKNIYGSLLKMALFLSQGPKIFSNTLVLLS